MNKLLSGFQGGRTVSGVQVPQFIDAIVRRPCDHAATWGPAHSDGSPDALCRALGSNSGLSCLLVQQQTGVRTVHTVQAGMHVGAAKGNVKEL